MGLAGSVNRVLGSKRAFRRASDGRDCLPDFRVVGHLRCSKVSTRCNRRLISAVNRTLSHVSQLAACAVISAAAISGVIGGNAKMGLDPRQPNIDFYK